jgi:hypothetical protein
MPTPWQQPRGYTILGIHNVLKRDEYSINPLLVIAGVFGR